MEKLDAILVYCILLYKSLAYKIFLLQIKFDIIILCEIG